MNKILLKEVMKKSLEDGDITAIQLDELVKCVTKEHVSNVKSEIDVVDDLFSASYVVPREVEVTTSDLVNTTLEQVIHLLPTVNLKFQYSGTRDITPIYRDHNDAEGLSFGVITLSRGIEIIQQLLERRYIVKK